MPDIEIMGATYPDVPSVTLPKTGGGTAAFTDVTDTTAEAGDVAAGEYFYTAAGVRTLGTASGGGRCAYYGTCSTSASTAAKVVTCEGFTLATGNLIAILFSTANTASTPTLNVNSTGAVSIRVGSSAPSATANVLKWSANTVVYFIYDGTYFRYLGAQAAGSVQQPDGAGAWYGISSTAATTAAKTSTIANFRLTLGAFVAIRFSTANTYTSGAMTLNVNSTGAKTIYKGASATSSTNTLTWDANATLYFAYDGSNWRYLGTDASYELPAATASTLGGVKVGSGLSVASDGTLSATGGGGGGATYTTQAVSIPVSAWSGTTATVSASAVTASNDVIVAPAPASMAAWASAGVYCSAQGAGTLTFTCSTAPTSALTANVMAFEGGNA